MQSRASSIEPSDLSSESSRASKPCRAPDANLSRPNSPSPTEDLPNTQEIDIPNPKTPISTTLETPNDRDKRQSQDFNRSRKTAFQFEGQSNDMFPNNLTYISLNHAYQQRLIAVDLWLRSAEQEKLMRINMLSHQDAKKVQINQYLTYLQKQQWLQHLENIIDTKLDERRILLPSNKRKYTDM